MKKYLVIGNPINHSLSPKLHNYWFNKYKLINHVYDKREVLQTDLEKVIGEIRKDKIAGINITVPFKKMVIPYCDKLDQTAEDLQSVNTISKKNDQIIGWNTDSIGFQDSITQVRNFDKSKPVLILGAGGVTSSVLDALWGFGFKKIYLSNRTKDKASELKAQFDEKFDKIELLNWEKKPAEKCLIVINTTSLGLKESDKLNYDFSDYKNPDLKDISNNFVFVDLIYNQKTNFLKAAEKRGNLIINGKGMFLSQAKHAFNIWTNILPKIDKEVLNLIAND